MQTESKNEESPDRARYESQNRKLCHCACTLWHLWSATGVLLGAAIAQRGTVAPPDMLRCRDDPLVIARICHIDCLQVDSRTGCVVGCNRTCNDTMTSKTPLLPTFYNSVKNGDSLIRVFSFPRIARQCPTLERCTLGCVLQRDPVTQCPMCRCRDDSG